MKKIFSLLAVAATFVSSAVAAKADNFVQGRQLLSANDYQVLTPRQRVATENQILTERLQYLARAVIAEAFSNKVITPGVTSADDVAWYIRERFEQLDLPVWFMPYVNLQRESQACEADNPFCGSSGIIQRGDVLHTDVGICYLKLCTDTQEMAYVLKNTETDAPGPTIGMWDNQGPTPVQGDWPVYANTAYAIEGNIKQAVPGWQKQLVQIKLEQSAYFDGKQVIYLAGRQTQWHLIR